MAIIPSLLSPVVQYAGNPIATNSISWGTQNLADPNAIVNPFDSTEILITCSGLTTTSINTCRVGLFTAPRSNPRQLTDRGVVLSPSGSGYDTHYIRNGTGWYFDGTKLWMPFETQDGSNAYNFGMAYTTDGRTFVKAGQIITRTGNGRDDGGTINVPAMCVTGSTLVMLYTVSLGGYRYATASTSAPAGTWTKQGGGSNIYTDSYGNCERSSIQSLDANSWGLFYECGSGSVAFKDWVALGPNPWGPFVKVAGALVTPFGSGFAANHVATPNPLLLDGVWWFYYQGGGGAPAQPYTDNFWQLGIGTMPTQFVYDNAAVHLQGKATAISWTGATIKARLLDVSATVAITDTVMTGYTKIGTDPTLNGKSLTTNSSQNRTTYGAANATVTSIAAGSTYAAVVVYQFVTDDDHSIPLFYLPVTPAVTDGTDQALTWDSVKGCGYTQNA
jgi:hypothetical protein